jgi:hypothetical protein
MKTVRFLILSIILFSFSKPAFASSWTPYFTLDTESIYNDPNLTVSGNAGLQSPCGKFNFDLQVLSTDLYYGFRRSGQDVSNFREGIISFMPGISFTPFGKSTSFVDLGIIARIGQVRVDSRRTDERCADGCDPYDYRKKTIRSLHLDYKGSIQVHNHVYITSELTTGDEINKLYFRSGIQYRF